MNNDHVAEPFRSLLNDIREATQTLTNCAAKGPLQPDGTRMSYLRTRDDDDPYYMSPEEEKQMEADAEVERLHAEVAQQARVIADLDEALTKIVSMAGDYGDGAPDSHYLARVMLELEAIATSALDEARGTHRKALEAMQKRQQP